MTTKLPSGGIFPEISLPLAGGGQASLGTAGTSGNWRLVFVYRGVHCPICHKYLAELESLRGRFSEAGAEIIAVSGDSRENAEKMVSDESLTIPVAYDLSVIQMQEVGLWISEPLPDDAPTQPFPEPGFFGINPDGKIQLIDQSNTPFHRPDLVEVVETIEWINSNDYPIRGTYLQG